MKSNTRFEDGSEIFEVVEETPSFPGGVGQFGSFLEQNIVYPPSSRELGIQGRVLVQFIVEKDGSITDSRIRQSVESDLDDEALRVIRRMPRWSPGRHNGQPVRVRVFVPVVFSLNGQ